MRIFFIIFFLIISINIFSQNNRYIDEENNAINDIFINLVDTNRYYLKERPFYSWRHEDLKKYAKNPKKYKSNLDYLDSLYNPFEFSKLLIETKGNKDLIDDFEDKFDDYADSIIKQKDSSILKIFITNELGKPSKWEIHTWIDISFPDTISPKLYPVDTTLQKRYFDYNYIKNKGRYVFSLDKYPDWQGRLMTKKTKEIGILSISRISFNKDFTNGIFFYEIYKDNLDAEGYTIIIEKINNVWKIKIKSQTWVS